MIDLPAHWKAQLQEVFSHWVPEFEVWAYGSRVTQQCHDASDLDVVLIHPDNLPCTQLPNLREALSNSAIPISVDVLDGATMPEAFWAQVNAQRRLLFDASPVQKSIATPRPSPDWGNTPEVFP
jgi:uncharacterized protein